MSPQKRFAIKNYFSLTPEIQAKLVSINDSKDGSTNTVILFENWGKVLDQVEFLNTEPLSEVKMLALFKEENQKFRESVVWEEFKKETQDIFDILVPVFALGEDSPDNYNAFIRAPRFTKFDELVKWAEANMPSNCLGVTVYNKSGIEINFIEAE